MKLLRDENLPVRLKYRFSKEIEVATVNEIGWNAIKNGELKLMASHGYDIIITADRNLRYQQNLQKYGIAVMLLISNDNRYHTLKEYIPLIEKYLPPKVDFGVIEIALKYPKRRFSAPQGRWETAVQVRNFLGKAAFVIGCRAKSHASPTQHMAFRF